MGRSSRCFLPCVPPLNGGRIVRSLWGTRSAMWRWSWTGQSRLRLVTGSKGWGPLRINVLHKSWAKIMGLVDQRLGSVFRWERCLHLRQCRGPRIRFLALMARRFVVQGCHPIILMPVRARYLGEVRHHRQVMVSRLELHPDSRLAFRVSRPIPLPAHRATSRLALFRRAMVGCR